MLVCFFDHKMVVYNKFFEQRQTVYHFAYLQELKEFGGKVWNFCWTSGFFTIKMLLNMMHWKFTSSWLRNRLQKWTIQLINQILYTDFWLFSKLKNVWQLLKFADISNI